MRKLLKDNLIKKKKVKFQFFEIQKTKGTFEIILTLKFRSLMLIELSAILFMKFQNVRRFQHRFDLLLET